MNVKRLGELLIQLRILICLYIANGEAKAERQKFIRDNLVSRHRTFISVLKSPSARSDLTFMILLLFLYSSEKKDSAILPASAFLVLSGMSLERESLDMNPNPNEKR